MQFYQVSQTSLAKSGSSVVEMYVPLWMADGTYISIAATTPYFIQDGTVNTTTASTGSAVKLFTLNSNWLPTQKFAFEASIEQVNSGGGNATATLYDITNGTAVTSVSTTSTSVAVIRSGQFTLIPGHSYGVSINNQYSSGSSILIVDASLVVFGQ